MSEPENPFTKDGKPLKAGLYFGLRDELYFNDPALSRTDILALAESPAEYWYASWMSPKRRLKKPTPAMREGTAFHTLFLQPEQFKERYTVQPGEPWKKGAEMIKRPDYDKMVDSIEILKRSPKIHQLFQYGAPEVVMVWRDKDSGLMMRSKADYMKSFGVTDYKTTSRGLSNQALYREVKQYGYHVQDALYADGFTTLREAIKKKEAGVYGSFDKEFVKTYLASDTYLPVKFVFQLSRFPHAVTAAEIDDEDRAEAAGIIRHAQAEYLRCMKQYGTDKDWMPQDDHVVLSRFRG
jgi:hypothetical protein